MANAIELSLPLLLVIAGFVISVFEAIAPGAHFVVLGGALLGAGLLGLIFTPLATPLALAVLILVIGGGTLFAYRNLDIYGGKGIARTSDSDDLLGREGVVIEPVSTTGGKVRLYDGGFDPEYSARTVDGEIEEGEEVIVIDPGGGSVLTVESMDGYDEIDRELNTDDSVSSESTTDSE